MATDAAAQTTARAAQVSSRSQLSNHVGIVQTLRVPLPLLTLEFSFLLLFFSAITFAAPELESRLSSFSGNTGFWQQCEFPFSWQHPITSTWDLQAAVYVSLIRVRVSSSVFSPTFISPFNWNLSSWDFFCSSSDKPIWPLNTGSNVSLNPSQHLQLNQTWEGKIRTDTYMTQMCSNTKTRRVGELMYICSWRNISKAPILKPFFFKSTKNFCVQHSDYMNQESFL